MLYLTPRSSLQHYAASAEEDQTMNVCDLDIQGQPSGPVIFFNIIDIFDTKMLEPTQRSSLYHV